MHFQTGSFLSPGIRVLSTVSRRVPFAGKGVFSTVERKRVFPFFPRGSSPRFVALEFSSELGHSAFQSPKELMFFLDRRGKPRPSRARPSGFSAKCLNAPRASLSLSLSCLAPLSLGLATPRPIRTVREGLVRDRASCVRTLVASRPACKIQRNLGRLRELSGGKPVGIK